MLAYLCEQLPHDVGQNAEASQTGNNLTDRIY